jgi:hypothetical protein
MNTFAITVEIAGKWEDGLLPVHILSLKNELYWTTWIPCPFCLGEGLKEWERVEISGKFAIDMYGDLSPYVTEIKRI